MGDAQKNDIGNLKKREQCIISSDLGRERLANELKKETQARLARKQQKN